VAIILFLNRYSRSKRLRSSYVFSHFHVLAAVLIFCRMNLRRSIQKAYLDSGTTPVLIYCADASSPLRCFFFLFLLGHSVEFLCLLSRAEKLSSTGGTVYCSSSTLRQAAAVLPSAQTTTKSTSHFNYWTHNSCSKFSGVNVMLSRAISISKKRKHGEKTKQSRT
jgi:hypothetical protein